MKNNGKEIINFISNKWNNQCCPMCGGREWSVADKIFELREFNEGNLVLGGPNSSVVPLIPVTCEKCGNTVLINAITAGAIKG